jgi:hypothetical protein
MALSKTAKIVLTIGIVGAVLATGLIAVVAGGFFWFRSHEGELKKSGETSIREGASFGAAHSQAECITESLARKASCDGILCEGGVHVFLEACLSRSPADSATCVGIPAQGEILKSVKAMEGRCAALGHPNSPSCQRLMQSVFIYCQKP